LSVVCVLMWNCLIGGDIWGDPLKITPKREVSKRSKIAKPLPEADGGAVITYLSTQLTKRSLSQIWHPRLFLSRADRQSPMMRRSTDVLSPQVKNVKPVNSPTIVNQISWMAGEKVMLKPWMPFISDHSNI
jgi:hypothetical protein